MTLPVRAPLNSGKERGMSAQRDSWDPCRVGRNGGEHKEIRYFHSLSFFGPFNLDPIQFAGCVETWIVK